MPPTRKTETIFVERVWGLPARVLPKAYPSQQGEAYLSLERQKPLPSGLAHWVSGWEHRSLWADESSGFV